MTNLDPREIKPRLTSGEEIAFLDVREYGQYGEGHPFFAVNLPYSRLELVAEARLPRKTAPVVLMDDGDGVAERPLERRARLQKFLTECDLHGFRVVRVDRHGNAGVDEPSERVVGDRGIQTQHRVGRRADVEGGAVLGEPLFARGAWGGGDRHPFDPAASREDVSHAWMSHRSEPAHPYDGITVPDAEAEDGYTWCKAPRLDGQVVEVGALARQVVDGHPLVRDLVARSGGNVRNRVIARLLEIARIVMAMEDWARALQPRDVHTDRLCVGQERAPVELG